MKLNKAQTKIYKEMIKADEIFLYGGARSGKTTLILFKIIEDAININKSKHLVVRNSFQDMKNSIIDNVTNLLEELAIRTKILKSNPTVITLKNNSKIFFTGIKEYNVDKILGNEYFNIYINEASEVSFEIFEILKTRLSQMFKTKKSLELKNKIFIDCNPTNKKHWTYKYFIEENKNNALVRKLNPEDNSNISNKFLDILKTLSSNKQRRFLYGEYSDSDGEVFLLSDIKYETTDDLEIKILAIDPAISNNEKSDETGIILVGIKNKKYFIIEDYSGKFETLNWIKKIETITKEIDISFIVIEINQGGDLIKALLSKNIKTEIKTIFSKNSKYTRATYLKSIYNENRIFHFKVLPKLEEQILNFTGLDNENDDRIDALMHGIIYLEQLKNKKIKIW